VFYAVKSYHRVVDLPFGEKRGFEAATYRPWSWSLKVGLMAMERSKVDVDGKRQLVGHNIRHDRSIEW
jgi:hypothetical protein